MPDITQKNDLIQGAGKSYQGFMHERRFLCKDQSSRWMSPKAAATISLSSRKAHHSASQRYCTIPLLHDTIEGFMDLQTVIQKVKEKSGSDTVPVVFEATGAYHRCLQKYLEDHGMPYYIISPLLAAAYRKTNLHSNKTDDLDCAHIAKAYFNEDDLLPFQKQTDLFNRLQRLNRYYEVELNHLRMFKVTFRSYLDIIYPRMDKCFKG